MAPEPSPSRPLAPGERWYVAMTLPYKERYAGINLSNQGYRHFLPLQATTVRHGRHFRDRLSPVFPRYLFVALDLELQRWRRINGTFGIRYLVCQGNRPLATPNGVVEALLQSSDSEGRLIAAEDDLTPGKSVRVVTGSFAGLTGVVQRLDGAKRVKLLLEILGVARAASTLRKTVTPV